MKDDVFFFTYFPQTIIICKGRKKTKYENNYQIGLTNYFVFKNFFQINSTKLFYKKKSKHTLNYFQLLCKKYRKYYKNN